MLRHVQLRFEPRTLPLKEVMPDNLPWPTRDELTSMKALSASERSDEEKARKDVGDIEALLELQPGPLLFPGSTMAEANKAMVKELVPGWPSSAAGRRRSGSRDFGYKRTYSEVSPSALPRNPLVIPPFPGSRRWGSALICVYM